MNKTDFIEKCTNQNSAGDGNTFQKLSSSRAKPFRSRKKHYIPPHKPQRIITSFRNIKQNTLWPHFIHLVHLFFSTLFNFEMMNIIPLYNENEINICVSLIWFRCSVYAAVKILVCSRFCAHWLRFFQIYKWYVAGPPVEVGVTMYVLSISSVSEVLMVHPSYLHFKHHPPQLLHTHIHTHTPMHITEKVPKPTQNTLHAWMKTIWRKDESADRQFKTGSPQPKTTMPLINTLTLTNQNTNTWTHTYTTQPNFDINT